MIWIIVVAVIIFTIYLITKDHNEDLQTNVINQGGMMKKYRVIIDYYVNVLSAKVTHVNATSIVISTSDLAIYLDYVGGNLEVLLKGVAPTIGKYSKRWKYPEGYPQKEIIKDIQTYCQWQLNKIVEEKPFSNIEQTNQSSNMMEALLARATLYNKLTEIFETEIAKSRNSTNQLDSDSNRLLAVLTIDAIVGKIKNFDFHEMGLNKYESDEIIARVESEMREKYVVNY